MGVDTKSILFGNPNAAEIAQTITEAFGFEPEIRLGFGNDEKPTYFILSFPDTEDQSKHRQLHIFTETSDNKDVFDGPSTHCMLGMWGGSIEIMEALARKFGGFVCDSDFDGDWRPVERVENADAPLAPLPPEAVLNLTLAKVIDPKAAIEIRKLVKDREQFAKLMDALEPDVDGRVMERLPISPDAGKTEAKPEQIADWIDRHFAKPMLLPCRVDEMTEREAEIFKVAAHHLGFIQFLRTTLPTTRNNS